MRISIKAGIVAVATVACATLISVGGASAACIHTEWQNTMKDHVIPHITGRDCDGVLSINAQGLDAQGQLVDFGWAQAEQIGPDTFKAAFVGADATNDLTMEVNPANETMHVAIDTKYTNGTTKEWFGNYKLNSVK